LRDLAGLELLKTRRKTCEKLPVDWELPLSIVNSWYFHYGIQMSRSKTGFRGLEVDLSLMWVLKARDEVPKVVWICSASLEQAAAVILVQQSH
jgi:hypothetical protein